MSNIVSIGNTPIFDQLVLELAARGKRFENLLSPKRAESLQPTKSDLRVVPAYDAVKSWGVSFEEASQRLKDFASASPSAKDFIAPGAWIARPVPRINLEKPKVEETFDPNALIEQAIDPNLHVQQIVKRFTSRYPGIEPVHITRSDNIDGTVTISVSQGDQRQTGKAVNADPRYIDVKPLYEVPPKIYPDMLQVNKLMILEDANEPEYIGEDTAQSLYMKPSPWGSDEE